MELKLEALNGMRKKIEEDAENEWRNGEEGLRLMYSNKSGMGWCINEEVWGYTPQSLSFEVYMDAIVMSLTQVKEFYHYIKFKLVEKY